MDWMLGCKRLSRIRWYSKQAACHRLVLEPVPAKARIVELKVITSGHSFVRSICSKRAHAVVQRRAREHALMVAFHNIRFGTLA